jgi:DNA mismatch repair protein MutS
MTMDGPTLRSLEVLESEGGGPTLLTTLDRTRTDMGGRMLRRWLRQPLLNVAEIIRRQEMVEWFCREEAARGEMNANLSEIADLERLTNRARAKSITPREMLVLGRSLEVIPRLRAVLARDAHRFRATLAALPVAEAAAEVIKRAIADEDWAPNKNRSVIRDGYSEELDRLRALLLDGRKFLAEIEQRERARTGIKSLRVGFNKVFGYYIEVTKPNLHLVPADYNRKQTLTNAERFITLELKEHETLVTNAEERLAELETGLFRHVCAEVGRDRDEILIAASTVAFLDAVISLAGAAREYAYVRPEITEEPVLIVKDGRHPVVERLTAADAAFVANDLALGGPERPQIALLTGPNMSGKSTYLRQAAMIALLAQIGSFVPASAATVGVCDRIFTRAGLYDRINRGESTFMTEMVETANIMHHATPRSLVLLDELGRGTSTYDGLAVARAVLEYLHNHPQVRSRTLFATHYHELAELADILPRVKNYRIEIEEQGGELIFLHKISEGSAEHSYGVYAARLAGLPRPIIKRAEELLHNYEARGNPQPSDEDRPATEDSEAIRQLKNLDLDSLSPVEALMKLYELSQIAKKE